MSQVIPAGSINSNATIAAGVVVIESLVPGTISGIPTNIIGAAGTSTWGPTNSLVFVSTPAEFSTLLGSVVPESFDLGTFVNASFLQGPVANYACVRVTDGTDTMAFTRLLDTAVMPVTGVILTAKYSGTTGNTLQASVTPGVVLNTYNISIGRPGYASELFSNIGGSGNEFWQNVISAINNGQSGIRGPSNYVIASAGDGVSAIQITNGGSNYSTPPAILFSGGGGGINAAATSVLGFAISSVSVILGGSYLIIPTVTTIGPGSGAIFNPIMSILSATFVASGSGYTPADTLTLVGGSASPVGTLIVSTTQLVSIALNAAGTGYAPGDIETLIGGTFSTAAQLTCLTTQVVSATVANGGSGGTPGTQTVTGTTGTGTKFQASVTVSGGGSITAVLSITVGGSYTVNPTILANEPVTGAGLTGASLNVVMGINTASITNPGSYTVNSTSFTSSSSGSGVGATFNSGLFGVNTVVPGVGGAYTTLPTGPVSVTGGTGTNATFTVLWDIDSISLSAAGSGYTASTTIAFSGSGGATASISLAATGSVISAIITNEGTGYPVAPVVAFNGGGGSNAAGLAIIGSTTAPSLVLNPYEFSGGTNGNSGVTVTTLIGTNGELPTGMYVLANSNCSLFALVDNDDSTTFTTQDSFASQIGAQAILVGVPGQTVSQGISVKNSAGISDNFCVFMLGDWCNWLDTNNGGITRMISPQGFYAGLMGNLSPEQSPLNKPIFGIISTQKTLQNQVYSNQDKVNMTQNGIEVISNPIARGNAFGCLTGRSAGIESTTNFVNIQRMANFLAFSFAGSALLSQFIGDLQTPSVQVSARNSLESFLKNLESSQMITDSSVILNSTNNPLSQVQLGFMQANVSVQLFSVIVVFLINLNVGTGSITSTIQSITPGVLA